MPRWIVADVETTGVDPEIDKAVEVAWCELEEDTGVVLDSEFSSLIDPGRDVPCSAAAVNGLRSSYLREQQPPRIEEIEFPEGEIVLISHNTDFDYEFLKDHMNIVDTICTMKMARRLLPGLDNYKLATLSCYLNLPQQISHRALADVRDCCGVIDNLCDRQGFQLPQLLRYMKANVVLKFCQIGRKHVGELWSDVPKSYLQWILREGTFDSDTNYTARYWLGR